MSLSVVKEVLLEVQQMTSWWTLKHILIIVRMEATQIRPIYFNGNKPSTGQFYICLFLSNRVVFQRIYI